MRIAGARIALDANRSQPRDLFIRNGRVSFSDDAESDQAVLDLRGFLILPGLINSHDHLEFNLFPKLGGGTYPNAKVWAADINRPVESPVAEHLSLSKRARLMWGGLKNLLSGVTTVAHHNACDHPQLDSKFPVNVVKQFGWAHSLDFSPDLAERFRAAPPDWPFIIHAAEGVDECAASEIARLDALGVLGDRTVLVHALGLDQAGLELLKKRRCSIVWCPSSNLSTYGRTLTSSVFQSGLNISLGTDSAMTAQADFIDEIGVARRGFNLSAEEIYEMVTTRAARVLRLRDGQGSIREDGAADLLAVQDRGQNPADALLGIRPELVMTGGAIRLLSPLLRDRVEAGQGGPLYLLKLEGRGCWFTDVDVPSLHEETVRALGPAYRLAGRRVW